MSDNWVVQNLQNALDTWNKYLTEIWQLIAQSPAEFKGGATPLRETQVTGCARTATPLGMGRFWAMGLFDMIQMNPVG